MRISTLPCSSENTRFSMKKAGMPATRPVSIGWMMRKRKRCCPAAPPPSPSGSRDHTRPLTSFRRRCHSGELEPKDGAVQPPPAVFTQTLPTCQTPSPVSAAARTGVDCCNLTRKPSLASPRSGKKRSTSLIGLESTNTSTCVTPGTAEASTPIGTLSGFSAVIGATTFTRSSNTTGALPKNSLRMSPQLAEPSGSETGSAIPPVLTNNSVENIRIAENLTRHLLFGTLQASS